MGVCLNLVVSSESGLPLLKLVFLRARALFQNPKLKVKAISPKHPETRNPAAPTLQVGDHYQHCSLFAKFFASWIIPQALADKHLQEEH